MGFFSVSTSADTVRDFTGVSNSKFITKSGIYNIIIKNMIVNTSPNGSQSIDLFISYNNQDQMLYNAIRLTNNDGSRNVSADLFNKLLIILGATEGDDIAEPVPMQLPIGKNGELKECMVLDEDVLKDVLVFVRVQLEYSLYNGKIQERKIVRNFFRYTDKATAAEIVNETEVGQQYAKEEEYAEVITYKDDLTEEDIDNWIKSGRNSVAKETKKPKTGFGVKRTFGHK
jgi:hypothetical protein